MYMEMATSRVRVDEDIRPLSEFRAGVATFVKQIHETGRPMVQARLEMLEDLYQAEDQIAAGDGVSHEDAKARVLARFSE